MTNQRTWDANHNAVPPARTVEKFRAARSRLIARLEAMDPEGLEASALHPRLKVQLRVIDLAYFAAEHDDYHLARVHELFTMFRSEVPGSATVELHL